MGISKKQAISIAIKEAKNYKEKLANTVLLLLYRDQQDHQIKTLEIEFHPDKFQHLTGLFLTKIDPKTGQKIIREHTAIEFYHRCTRKPYITESEIEYRDNKTIDLKMLALPYITQITKITKMSGTYNRKKPNLEADFIIGGVNACIGISKYPDRNTYFPRTCLKEDIRKITEYTSPVIAIFQAPYPNNSGEYKHILYVAKGINLNKLSLPDNIKKKIVLEEYKEPLSIAKKKQSNTFKQNNEIIQKELSLIPDNDNLDNFDITDDFLDR